jgi:hypothetical protein
LCVCVCVSASMRGSDVSIFQRSKQLSRFNENCYKFCATAVYPNLNYLNFLLLVTAEIRTPKVWGHKDTGATPLYCNYLCSSLEPITKSFFSVWQLRLSCCGAPSLTREWICNLLVQLHLGLARAVTLESQFRRTQTICLFHFRLQQPGQPDPRTYIPQEQGGPVIPPGTGFPFLRLIRLVGPRRRYSSPPPHGLLSSEV